MISVFISHVSEDAAFARRLVHDLRGYEFDAHTFQDILPADALLADNTLDASLSAAINRDPYFVPIITPAALESKWMGTELAVALAVEARRDEVTVLPLLAHPCSPPEPLGLRPPADFTGSYQDGLIDLVRRLA